MLEQTQQGSKMSSLKRQQLLLSMAIAAIVLASGLAFFTIQRLTASSARVAQSQDILVKTNRYLSDVKDIETGSRSYLITGDRRHLQTYFSGVSKARRFEVGLRQVKLEPEVRLKFDKIVALAHERMRLSDQIVQPGSSLDSVQGILAQGTEVMEHLRSEVADAIALQTNIYRNEQKLLERQAWLTSLVLAASVITCIILISWLFHLRGREVERRRLLESELRQFNMQLEDRVQERTSDVKRARDLLDAAFENLPDMIFLKEAIDGFRYILVNSAGEKFLGKSREEIVGKIDHELFPRREADLLVSDSETVIKTGRPQLAPDRRLTTAEGERTVESRTVPIAGSAGSPGLVLSIIRDITNARSTEEQLRQLQRMDAIGRLTGGVAHDFNNLLAIIHGNTELLRERYEDGSDEAEMTDDVIGAAGRGAELVKRLLAFARMQHLESRAVDLNARLPNMAGLLERALGETVQVQVKTSDELWPANIDPTQVDDALLNLAINARDAMPEGGRLTIETQNVHLDEDYAAHHVEVTAGDYVMLAVSDTGTGMTPEVIARAFEPFFTTKEEGQGTGLGLSQVFGWVKQSGGHIKIYSEVGHGTTIKLYLPRAFTDEDDQHAQTEQVTPRGDEVIFVVEDNPNVRRTVVRQLHDLGYRTFEADGGTNALKMIEEGAQFDLLLTDVVMPGGMTGYDLADHARELRPELKILFTSGYTELARANDRPASKDALLSKPYRKIDLGLAVRAALDGPRSSDAG